MRPAAIVAIVATKFSGINPCTAAHSEMKDSPRSRGVETSHARESLKSKLPLVVVRCGRSSQITGDLLGHSESPVELKTADCENTHTAVPWVTFLPASLAA